MKILFRSLAVVVLLSFSVFGQLTEQYTLKKGSWQGLHFASTTTGWVVGDSGRILKTVDGGNSWQLQSSNTSLNLSGVHFINDSLGLVAGQNGIFLKTTNAGATWSKVSCNLKGSIDNLKFFDNKLGFASSSTTVYKTTNGGSSWAVIKNDTLGGWDYNSVCFNSSNEVWIGTLMSVYHTKDAGGVWDTLDTPSGEYESVNYINNKTGIVLGHFGNYFTTDAGKNWKNVLEYMVGYSSFLVDNNFAFVICSPYKGNVEFFLYRTVDCGASWEKLGSLPMQFRWKSFFVNSNVGWILAGGSILRYSYPNSNEGNDPSKLPQNFVLEQNYPNPFNPSTVISYKLAAMSNVRLTIYNSLGQEIKTLVNETQNAGVYKVNFDALNQPSGVYFYNLSFNGNSVTKKMMLMK